MFCIFNFEGCKRASRRIYSKLIFNLCDGNPIPYPLRSTSWFQLSISCRRIRVDFAINNLKAFYFLEIRDSTATAKVIQLEEHTHKCID